MSEREVGAQIVGRRYLCVLASSPPMYPHKCAQGHEANLLRRYPGYDVHIDPIA